MDRGCFSILTEKKTGFNEVHDLFRIPGYAFKFLAILLAFFQ